MTSCRNSVTAGIVAGYADVVDPVPFSQVSHSFYKWSAVVGHNLLYSSPAAKNLFKYEIADSFVSFCSEGAELRPCG